MTLSKETKKKLHEKEIKILEILEELTETYGKELNESMERMWKRALGDLSVEQLEYGITKIAREHTTGFMPTHAEFREAALTSLGSSFEDDAVKSWYKVEAALKTCSIYDGVTFDDNCICVAIERGIGGWDKLIQSTTDNLVWLKKEFIKEYVAIKKSGMNFNLNYLISKHHMQYLNNQLPRVNFIGSFKEEEKKQLALEIKNNYLAGKKSISLLGSGGDINQMKNILIGE